MNIFTCINVFSECEEYSKILSKTVIKPSLIEGDSLTVKKDKCSHSAVELIVGGKIAGDFFVC